MMDGRRHSVDIPISKTLLALRRVKSLRDPSTNSMSKFSTFVDNLNWDINSINAINLGFVNSCEEDGIANKHASGPKDLGLKGQKEENVTDLDLLNGFKKPNSKLTSRENSVWVGNTRSVPTRTKQVVASKHCGSNHEVVCENKSLNERYCNDYTDKGLDLTCITPSNDCLEGVGSCNEPTERSLQAERLHHNASNRKTRYRKQIRSSRAVVGDIVSRVGSPCLSISDALEGSSCGTSLFGNGDVDVVDHNHRGCGISCWSGTPRFRESNIPSDVEGQPLLSGEVDETLLSGKRKNRKHRNNEIALYLETPQTFSQKFRPKSFCELVGQNVVARSLLTAILNARISSFYLFHGPRGTGKTSASRIFAAALNCLSVEENRPCGLCQECCFFFSGRSRDVKEVDSVRINRKDRVRSLIKNATIPPVSSRFKVFIIDECHLLRAETWATVLNNLEDFSRHVVFVMITPNLDKLPRSAVSRSQRYHFPKIKVADIASRLGKICGKEGLEFELVALDFIATKSNGSLRDAEMMLEQLSLIGKRITIPLVYELIGIVSDDELLDLLDLALSSDSSNTVRRARELMRSKIDPMQLISQLANLIMDILAGKCQEGSSEVRRKFFSRHASEASLQQLNHALKILSETEKQLRTSKSQTTWLTVALLQLSSVGCSFLDANDFRLCERTVHPRDGDFCSTSSASESLKHLITCACHNNESRKLGIQDGKETLESIWKRAIVICQSNSLKNFLRKQGKLSSISFSRGMAVVDLEFHHPDYVNKAEKSWKLIANALQSVLGCNVEMRIYLVHCASVTKYAKMKKLSFSLFSCSRRMRHESQSTTGRGSDPSDNSDVTCEKAIIRDNYVKTCSSNCGSQIPQNCCQRKEAASTIRNNDGNALSIGMTMSHGLLLDLVKCDGAALYYQGKYYPLGVTPTEAQIKDIVEWLLAAHGDSTGLSTDSLAEAGYPGAVSLGDAVCGMAVAYITSKDFLFWFRSNTAKEVKWGGAKHHPEDKDDGQRMHPRSSFKAFLEVVKSRSLPWENAEMDAIHSLQLILRDSFKDAEGSNSKAVIHAPLVDLELQRMEEISSVAREMVRLIETATAPIFAVDIDGRINGWNAKVAELTGLSVAEAMGKSLVHDLVFKESEEIVDKLLYNALRGEEDKNVEIKLKTSGSEQHKKAVFLVVNACSSKDYTNNIVGVCFVGQDVTDQKVVMDKFIHIQGDYKAIVHSPNPLIPPIFASDENTCCCEWNNAMEKLTGWTRGENIGKMLVGDIFGSCCQLKGPDAMTKFMIVLHNAIGGQDTDKFPFAFFDRNGKYVQALLTANKRVSMDGQIIGAFCFLQIPSPELQQALEVHRLQENKCFARMKELAYICQEIKNPLSGIRFTNLLLEATNLTEDQKQFLETSAACEKQMLKIIRDVNLDSIENGSLELEKTEFLVGSVIDAVVSQGMILLRERGLQLIRDIPEEIKTLAVYGDQVRVQQVLADFLLSMVHYAPSPKGWVEIQVQPRLKQISAEITMVHIEFRIVCPGEGLPSELVQDMFRSSRWVTQEGLGLSMCRKILKLMNGEVQYVRESERCYFLVILELPMPRRGSTSVD